MPHYTSAMARYRCLFPIRFYEVGPDGLVTLPTLANLLQQAAGEHASTLGLSQVALGEFGIGWLLSRLTIEIDRLPRYDQAVTVETWPSSSARGLFNRQFRILDEEDRELARASSVWAAFDLVERRLTALPEELTRRIPWEETVITAARPRTLPKIDDDGLQARILPRRADLDLNGHVNNAQVAGWLLDPLADRETASLRLVDITFRRECTLSDRVDSRAQPVGNSTYRHALTRHDGQELARGETRWF